MAALLDRSLLAARVRAALGTNPVVALLGPRQCGKTTLARTLVAASPADYFDLEDPVGLARLAAPMTALAPLRGLVIIDEVQRRPALFPILRVLADRPRPPARFLLLGSASPDLVRQSSETLAGRVAFVDMAGFDLRETGSSALRRLWLRGGFPRSFLARSDAQSVAWREDFIRTFLERDIGQLGVQVPAAALRRLWMMLAHYHGQTWNASEVGRSLGEAHTTVKRHLDILTGAFMVRQLQPWFANVSKRQVRAPKLFIRDSGILHALLGLGTFAALEGHPELGASWEGFALEQAILAAGERNPHFWATQAGAELDLLLTLQGKRYGVEAKYIDAPRMTKSMIHATHDLDLQKLFVVYPGTQRYALERKTEVLPLEDLLTQIEKLREARTKQVKAG
ncbi:MAG TPA: ATP-binding protein [Casimicrobiaceae bacterium]